MSDTEKKIGAQEVKTKRFWRSVFAEFLGTALLVLVGCGSVTGGSFFPPVNAEIAVCFGLTVGVIVTIIAPISGGHINPAITFGMFIAGNIPLLKAILYTIAQFLGAVAGAAALYGLVPNSMSGNLGQTLLHLNLSVWQGLGIEILITFVLVMTVFSVVDPCSKKILGPIIVGLSVTACHLWAIKYTGASMNTARSFGPALMQRSFKNHWIYWVGPHIGGAAGGLVYKYVFQCCRDEDALQPEHP